MGIDEAVLQDVEATVAAAQSPAVLAELRQKYPRMAWLRCDALDVDEAPWKTVGLFDLHLVGGDHCPGVVKNPAQATGFILARRA
ncbi:hypothetical protein SAMN06265338_10643 [Rhodoblastus acidophilus]|uniref:Uncharacterized protein n=1 Tax=Rhodoblastus acidophilus TaxID=1074 RepID=A0A212RP70_RHOAC|nr:hypothetical protein [Rhodoblastus acidophilus]PPQ36716.1 hypothetical protein CKO16_16945 [Rhodoblastus acidophilus]RAI21488.1 hypothetical protein CH337_07360 [Rhodoblastus acidophilus]SNB74337.1 hypothetical protein SAMN06265338_10643 [Rhodoblastus acidophilus]